MRWRRTRARRRCCLMRSHARRVARETALSQRVRAASEVRQRRELAHTPEHCAEAPLTAVRSIARGAACSSLLGCGGCADLRPEDAYGHFRPRPRSRSSRREERSPAASSCCGGGTRRQPPPRSPPPPRGTAKHARLGAAQGVPCAHSRSRSPASGRTSARVRSSRARRGVRRAWA